MKKLLLATMVAFGAIAPAAAQELAIQYKGENLENGASVVFTGYETQTFEEMPGYTIWTLDPQLYLVSDSDDPITIHATGNTRFQLCAGGTCMKGDDITKAVENLEEGVPLNLQLDWEDETFEGDELEIPEIKIEIEVWYDEDPENVYSISLTMGGFTASAGVESIGAALNSVVFNGRQLNYDVNGASNLSVFSLSGKTMINKTVSGNGSVSLDGLSKGVYLYRLTGKNGKAVKAAKIIIK